MTTMFCVQNCTLCWDFCVKNNTRCNRHMQDPVMLMQGSKIWVYWTFHPLNVLRILDFLSLEHFASFTHYAPWCFTALGGFTPVKYCTDNTTSELTFGDVWVSRAGVCIGAETVVTQIARRPYLIEMLNTDLMLSTTAADAADKPTNS